MRDRVKAAIQLLKEHEPPEGYYLAFSGGKDSCVIKELANMAGVKYNAFYNNTTIDPPELVRFIKDHHQDVKWNKPKVGMMYRVATRPGMPPTRRWRWCCEEYKEGGGGKLGTKIMGVRWEESNARRKRWDYVKNDAYSGKVICPIVDWTEEEIWGFIRERNIPYCKVYDEGWRRLGCVGCPLQSPKKQQKEFDRWPRYQENWKKAIFRSWEKYHDKLNRKGKLYAHSHFKTPEELWLWWISPKAKKPDVIRGDCQQMLLWTNEDVTDVVVA